MPLPREGHKKAYLTEMCNMSLGLNDTGWDRISEYKGKHIYIKL